MRCHRGVIIEAGGHECQKYTYPLIGGDGNLEQLFEDPNLLCTIRVLVTISTRRTITSGERHEYLFASSLLYLLEVLEDSL